MPYKKITAARPWSGYLVLIGVLSTLASRAAVASHPQSAQPPSSAASSPRTEAQLIAALDELRDDPKAEFLPGDLAAEGSAHKETILATIEELLLRFPNTSHRDEALILKMETLAHLAHASDRYVGPFLQATHEVQQSKPKGKLAVMAAYYSIQAFVLASRLEKMPEEKRLYGALERYRAFVEDFPDSEYAPVMWASWIRNAIKLGRLDDARQQVGRLHQKYPTHDATRRAMGEVSRVDAVGRPLIINLVDREGNPAGTENYFGKVLVVHCWASWSQRSMEELPKLKEMFAKYEKDGLAFLGINADKLPLAFKKAMDESGTTWQHVFDGKGMGNDVIVMLGVTELPDYFVVDRQGILRAINPAEGLEPFVQKLLKEPVRKIDIDVPPPDASDSPPAPPPASPKP